MENYKTWFLTTALSYLGTPYIWGGDDPSGFDCSGYVLECLKSIGVVNDKKDFTAHTLLHYLQHDFSHKTYTVKIIEKPAASALLFYLSSVGHAYHVAICLDENFQIGAIGGGRTTDRAEIAHSQNAFIKIRPIQSLERLKIMSIFSSKEQ